jgi:hypothetical protein
MADETITLWRPVGPKELKLIEAVDMRAFPPRLPEQPIFYPVLTEDYAVKIARDWNVPIANIGYRPRIWKRSTPSSSAGSRWFGSFAKVGRSP